MNSSGEAADQVIRMYLNGVEVAAKLSGSAAKHVAVMLYAVMRDQTKTKGKTRLTSMLRSGKELKVFAVRDGDLERFKTAAKEYGVLYCVLKDKDANDGVTDVMVRAEDAAKINRIFERFKLATVDLGDLRSEIIQSKEAKTKEPAEKSAEDKLIDQMLGIVPEKKQPENPTQGTMEKSPPSEPTSKREEISTPVISERKQAAKDDRPSVREEIRCMKEQRRTQAEPGRVKVRSQGNRIRDQTGSAADKIPKVKLPKGKER